ncbi:Hypothetical predicted protein [Pelobates cultripes]|uniref:Uncharacterized protein n=1 Tax=Pelobates cultripes TaxID=61616 RepID=A0AAD1TG09_PELCU|nr:Hypothetical predicted protein [Pelobates cultripes]
MTSLEAIFANFWAKLRERMTAPTCSPAEPAGRNGEKNRGRPPLGISIVTTQVSARVCPPGLRAIKGFPRKHRPQKRRPHAIKILHNPTCGNDLDSQSPRVHGLVVLAPTRVQGWKEAIPGHCPANLLMAASTSEKDSPSWPMWCRLKAPHEHLCYVAPQSYITPCLSTCPSLLESDRRDPIHLQSMSTLQLYH